MTTFHRAATVSAAVGAIFAALALWLAVPLVQAGTSFADMVPVLLGVTLKGTIAFALTGVMVVAIRLEARRMAKWREARNLINANDNLKRRKRRAA